MLTIIIQLHNNMANIRYNNQGITVPILLLWRWNIYGARFLQFCSEGYNLVSMVKTMINVYGYLGIKPVMIVSELGSTGESKCVTNYFSKKELSWNDSINGLLRLVVEVAN